MAVATSYESLANVYRYIYYDYTTAEEHYLKVLSLYNQNRDTNEKRMFKILYNLATTNRLRKNYEKALELGSKALTIARNLSDINREMCFQMLGNIFHSQGDYDQAISYYQTAIALTLAREGGFGKSLPRMYNNLSLAYLETDSVNTAVKVLNQSLHVYEAIGTATLREDQADTYEYIGNAYAKNNQFDSANLHYQHSLLLYYQIFGEKNRQISETLEVIAEFHEKQQQYDSAIVYYQKALIAGVPEFRPDKLERKPYGSHDAK